MIYFSPFLLFFVLLGCSGNPTGDNGFYHEKLAPCPDKPNCVSSQNTDQKHAIAPFRYESSMEEARQTLLQVLKSQKRARITSIADHYIHAEFTSSLFRFVDDVEFLIDDASKIIHVRSASRAGYSDLGVNRRRVENIHSRFNELSKERR